MRFYVKEIELELTRTCIGAHREQITFRCERSGNLNQEEAIGFPPYLIPSNCVTVLDEFKCDGKHPVSVTEVVLKLESFEKPGKYRVLLEKVE